MSAKTKRSNWHVRLNQNFPWKYYENITRDTACNQYLIEEIGDDTDDPDCTSVVEVAEVTVSNKVLLERHVSKTVNFKEIKNADSK